MHRQNITHNKTPLKKRFAQDRITNIKILAQVGGCGGDYWIPKNTFFFEEHILSFNIKIYCR